MMRSDLVISPFACVVRICLVFVFVRLWRAGPSAPSAPKLPRPTREPKPFAGRTRKPDCLACEQGDVPDLQRPGAPPPPMRCTRGRRWRQRLCLDCRGSFLETLGTPFHGPIHYPHASCTRPSAAQMQELLRQNGFRLGSGCQRRAWLMRTHWPRLFA